MDIIAETQRLLQLARTLRNSNREDMPMQACLIRHGPSVMLVQGLDDGLSAQQRGATLRQLIAAHQPVALVLIYEAWVATQASDASRSDLPQDLSQAPGAREVMIGTVETATFQRRWEAPIIDGLVGDFIESPMGSTSGPMANLLFVEVIN